MVEHERSERGALMDTLECMLGRKLYRQMVELCDDVDFRIHSVEIILSDLLEKDAGHFKAAHDQVVSAECALLIQRTIEAHHKCINGSANNVPVVSSDEFMLRLYKNLFREMLENIDILCFRSIKCVKFLRKMVRMNVRRAVCESVPVVAVAATPVVAVPVVEHQRIDDDINQFMQPTKDIAVPPAAPLPITPQPVEPKSTAASAAPSAAPSATQSAGKLDVKDVFAKETETAEVMEFKNYE